MKHGVITSAAIFAILLAAPLAARADAKPDFDGDAKPLLRSQPGLLQYVENHFEVRDTGTSKYPGDDDHRPVPPYIFQARPMGSHGPFNLRLLIQPGPAGHILNVVDMAKVHTIEPGQAITAPHQSFASHPQQQPPMQHAPPPASSPAQAPAQEAPVSNNEPTADTPTGPIMDPSSGSSQQSNLAPPPDPAPAAQ